MMKWLITGGSGFTGRYLMSTIQKKCSDDSILILDVNSPRFRLPNRVKFKPIDLLDEKKLSQVIMKEAPDRIIHLVGLMRNENTLLMTKTNVITCGILLDVIKSNRIQIDGILVIGSSAQYGEVNPENPPTEEDVCIPSSFYGYLKLLQEKIALEYYQKHEIPVICVRPANLIGPFMPLPFVVPRIISQLIDPKNTFRSKVRRLNLHYTKAGRDFIDVRDVVNAYTQLFENPKTRGEVFNIGTNKLTLLEEIIEKAKQILGIERVEIIEEKARTQFDLHLTDSCKIQSFIPWKPKIDLQTTLKDMIESFS